MAVSNAIGSFYAIIHVKLYKKYILYNFLCFGLYYDTISM